MSRRALVCWFTGLSGAGKTTVANDSAIRLRSHGCMTHVLDGDELRSVHGRLGFEPHDILQRVRFAASLCEEKRGEYDVIFVAMLSASAAARSAARAMLQPDFAEIYFAADLETVIARDVKGLYARAARGELTNVVGFSSGYPYEPPTHPDLIVDSGRESVNESVSKLVTFVQARLVSSVW